MPWPVRSHLLFSEIRASPGANTPHYSSTVPSGKTWLLKDWRYYNASGGSNSLYLLVSDGTNVYVVDAVLSVPSGNPKGAFGISMVIPEGYKLGYQVSSNAAVHVYMSGAILG